MSLDFLSFQECFQFVCETLPHALDVLNEAGDRVTKTHIQVQFLYEF
jgi:hypothetical protein